MKDEMTLLADFSFSVLRLVMTFVFLISAFQRFSVSAFGVFQ